MRVKIGPYVNWIGPYQIANALCFWVPENRDEYGIKTKPDWVHDFGRWLSEDAQGGDSWLTRFCQWVQDHRKRHIYVHIDNYDVWGADHTISLITLPLLEKLKHVKHGAPCVDDSDVPAGLGLRSTEAPAKENEWDVDANHFDRWEWVLDEMIWAHRQNVEDNPDEATCWQHDLPDPNWPYPSEAEGMEAAMGRIDCDWDKLRVFQERKANGFRLFGKYYQALWD